MKGIGKEPEGGQEGCQTTSWSGPCEGKWEGREVEWKSLRRQCSSKEV